MNSYIISKEEILEKFLSKEHYFQSLLQALYSNELLNSKEIERIQFQILNILKEKVGYYTKEESYSVKVEVAEQIMLSIYYTIGIFLKSKVTIKERITLIKETEMKDLLLSGEDIIKIKADESKKLLECVEKNKLKTTNYAYIETIDYGIPLFFKEYDMRFASHIATCSIDYPLAIDKMNLVGVEYINEYLFKLNLENRFCEYFSCKEIEGLLKGFDKNCDHMLINIFELVLKNYIGCILIGKKDRRLNITDNERYFLKSTMNRLKEEELTAAISLAMKKLCFNFCIEEDYFINYISKTVAKFIPEIKKNLELNKLENTFITLDTSRKKLIQYKDGEILSNSKFKSLTEEIASCKKVEDKIKIIRVEIHSLKDLVDVLSADCIFDDEFGEIFKDLEDFEIALLLKYMRNDLIDIDYGTESEKEWQEKFKEYLNNLSDEKRKKIIEMSEAIDEQSL